MYLEILYTTFEFIVAKIRDHYILKEMETESRELIMQWSKFF